MNKLPVLLLAFVACAYAAQDVPIVSQESDIQPDGAFHYKYETGDGVKAEAAGELRQIEKESPAVITGSFSYPGDDGKTYSVNYVADENGYQPTGDHLPQSPEIPAAIKKALDYLATAPPPKE